MFQVALAGFPPLKLSTIEELKWFDPSFAGMTT
jgi:hypothetical protein